MSEKRIVVCHTVNPTLWDLFGKKYPSHLKMRALDRLLAEDLGVAVPKWCKKGRASWGQSEAVAAKPVAVLEPARAKPERDYSKLIPKTRLDPASETYKAIRLTAMAAWESEADQTIKAKFLADWKTYVELCKRPAPKVVKPTPVELEPEPEADDDDDPTYDDWDECQSCHEFAKLVSVTDVPEVHDGEYCEKCAAALRKDDTELKF